MTRVKFFKSLFSLMIWPNSFSKENQVIATCYSKDVLAVSGCPVYPLPWWRAHRRWCYVPFAREESGVLETQWTPTGSAATAVQQVLKQFSLTPIILPSTPSSTFNPIWGRATHFRNVPLYRCQSQHLPVRPSLCCEDGGYFRFVGR